MKTLFYTMTLISIMNTATAQTKFDWLRGRKITNFVQVKVQGPSLKFRDGWDREDAGNYFSLSPTDKNPTVLRANRSRMNIKMSFLNPLIYTVKITDEIQDDPLFQTTTKFAESLTNLINLTAGGLEGLTTTSTVISPAEQNTKGSASVQNTDNQSGSKPLEATSPSTKVSAGIANWLLWNEYQRDKVKVPLPEDIQKILSSKIDSLKKQIKPIQETAPKKRTQAQNESFIKISSQISMLQKLMEEEGTVDCLESQMSDNLRQDINEVETYLHATFKPESDAPQRDFLHHVKEVIDGLKKAGNVKDLTEANNKASARIDALESKQSDIEKRANRIQGFGLASANKVSTDSSLCSAFIRYTQAEFITYAADVFDVLKKRAELLRQLRELTAATDKYLNEDHAEEILVDIGKMNIVKIAVYRREVQFDENKLAIIEERDPIKGFFTINESSWAVPEVAGGIFFPTNLNYTRYDYIQQGATNNNTNYQIISSSVRSRFVQAALFLNLIFDAKISPGLYPMIQIGVGTGNEMPSLLAGVGLRFYNKLSASVGIIGAFNKHPSYPAAEKLLNETTIDSNQKDQFVNSLKYQFEPGGAYIGFQWKF